MAEKIIDSNISVPFLNTSIDTIDKDAIFDGVREILKIIRPLWSRDSIQLKFVTGGITNALISCQLQDDIECNDVILIRIYGEKTELLVDREEEKRTILLLHEAGIAPPLYATFINGLAYKYVDGCTLSPSTVIQPKIYKLIAAQMAKLHSIKHNGVFNKPILWDKIQSFVNLVPDHFDDSEKQNLFISLYPTKAVVMNEIMELKGILDDSNNKIVFCHNDLLLGNVIFNEKSNSVTFIDFEYAKFNYQAFDIGNHFAEFIGTDNIQLDNYPNKELQLDWLREYLSVFNSPFPVTENELHNLYVQVNKFSLMSHLFWGVWCFIQAANSTIDFDFMAYGNIRFTEYFKKKNEFLSLK